MARRRSARPLAAVVSAALAVVPAALSTAHETAAAGLIHRSWSVEDGLPQSTVNQILETRDGYLWVATNGGLARFDGTSFTLQPLTTDDGRVRLRVRRLLEDGAGRLWVGTEGDGVGFLDHGRFTEVSDLAGHLVLDLAEDSAGRIWVATAADGVLTVDGDTLGVSRPAALAGVTGVTALEITADDTVWVGTAAGRLWIVSGGVARPIGPAEGLPSYQILQISPSPRGGVWLALDGGGVARCTDRVVEHYSGSMLDSGQQWAVLEDRDGELWLGGYVGSLQRIVGGRAERVLEVGELLGGPVVALHEDRTGAIWVGTMSRGLHRLTEGLFTVWNSASGDLPRDSVLAVTEDRQGTVWAGLNCGGLVAVDGDDARLVPVPVSPPGSCVWSLLAATDGSLWFGTWGGGVGRLRGGVVDRPVPVPELGSGVVVDALWQSRDGGVWVGTRDDGAYHWRDGELRHLGVADGLPSASVRCFAEDATGRLWVGTTDGLARLSDGVLEALPDALAWRGARVRAITVDGAGRLWVGTYGLGLGLLRDDRVVHIDRRHGLPDNVVSAVLDDGRGSLWLTGNRGIFRVAIHDLLAVADGSRQSVVPAVFGTDHGLPTVETAGGFQPAAWRARDGRLFFPTIGGLVAIDPADLEQGAPPKAVIEALLVDGVPVGVADDLRLPSGEHRLEVRYSGLDLAAPGAISFRYRLLGVDPDWISAGAQRTAVYHSVGPGRYRFEVQALTPAGGWSEQPAAVGFTVPEVLWRRWWFLLLVGVAAVVTPAAAVRWRSARRERRLRERVALLRRLEIAIVHEFRQPLQVLRTRLEIASRLSRDDRVAGSVAKAQEAVVRLETLADRIEHVHEDGGRLPLRYAGDEMMADLGAEREP